MSNIDNKNLEMIINVPFNINVTSIEEYEYSYVVNYDMCIGDNVVYKSIYEIEKNFNENIKENRSYIKKDLLEDIQDLIMGTAKSCTKTSGELN